MATASLTPAISARGSFARCRESEESFKKHDCNLQQCSLRKQTFWGCTSNAFHPITITNYDFLVLFPVPLLSTFPLTHASPQIFTAIHLSSPLELLAMYFTRCVILMPSANSLSDLPPFLFTLVVVYSCVLLTPPHTFNGVEQNEYRDIPKERNMICYWQNVPILFFKQCW